MEVMVVVGIIAILAAVAMPQMVRMIPDSRLKSAARDIVSCFQESKFRAVKENATVVILCDLANNRITSFVDNGPGGAAANWALDASEVVVVQVNMPPDINLYFSDFTANTFGFNGRGFPAAPSGRVRISNTQSNYREVSVNAAGNVKVLKSSDGAVWN